MNLKALITSLSIALGTSSAAMATPVISFSGHATVSVSTGPIVRDHRTSDDCGTPTAPVAQPAYRPVYQQPVYQQPVYQQPVWHEPYFNPTNTQVSASASVYNGTFGRGAVTNHYATAAFRPRTWFQLTEATRIDGGREFFNLRQQAGLFSKLALKNLGGRTEIIQVAIEYKSAGRVYVQKVKLDAQLTGQMSITINLARDSRTIQRVIVYGASGRGSAYQLLAM